MTLTKAEQLLLAEFDQAWAHYRHSETARTAHLGFLFTVTLGAAAAAATVLSSSNVNISNVGLTVFLAVYLVLVSFEYVSVRKADTVMSHYEAVQKRIRDHFYRDVDRSHVEPYRSLDIRQMAHPMFTGTLRRRVLRIQTATEVIFLMMAALGCAAEIAVVVRAPLVHDPSWLVACECVLGLAAILTVVCGIALAGTSATFRRAGTTTPDRTASHAGTQGQ